MDGGGWNNIFLLIKFGVPILFLVGAYVAGSIMERRHFASIRDREQSLQGFPVTNFEALPGDWQIGRSELVSGNVVISLDYFKRIIAGLRSLVGGRIKTYEPLLDRARREAFLRMVTDARERGYDAVINVRLETSRMANSGRDGEGTAGVEMLAFGTAVTLNRR